MCALQLSQFVLFQTMQEARTLQIAPTIQHQTQAMLKLLTRYNWTDFAVVTTEVAGHQDFIASLRSFVKQTHDAPEFTADGKRPVRQVGSPAVKAEIPIKTTVWRYQYLNSL